MCETRVVHVSEMDRFPDAVYIGRANGRAKLKASPFANPFKVSDGGRSFTVISYYWWLQQQPDLMAQLETLRGKDLACWCRHSDEARTETNWCHGDAIRLLLDDAAGDDGGGAR